MTMLNFAIPSKGRLKDNTEAWLAECGFRLRQVGGGRGYTAELGGLPGINVMLLSAREIAEGLISGQLHIGVTGEDLLHDLSSDVDRDIGILRRLGFGGADVVVAVPASWLDVDTMVDLEAAGALFRARHGRRMRVATKYTRLTRRFFSAKAVGEYRIVESAGATEAAPAAGTSELIVDITSTGATLRANDLKVLSDGVILKSQAALVGSRSAGWDDGTKDTLKLLLDQIWARASAKAQKKIEAGQDIPDSVVTHLEVVRLGARTLLCPERAAASVARTLALQGFEPVVITTVEHVFGQQNPVFDQFVSEMR